MPTKTIDCQENFGVSFRGNFFFPNFGLLSYPMPLTNISVKQAKSRDKPYKLYDAHGLFLLVTPTGGKWWRMKYKFCGKEKGLSLGTYPMTTLSMARAKLNEYLFLLANGVDPLERRKEEKAQKLAMEMERQNTFLAVARAWYEKNVDVWSAGHARTVIMRLEKDVFPAIGNIPIARLERGDFIGVVQKIEARGALEVARRVSQICGQVSRYAVDVGIMKHDVASGIAATVKKSRAIHHAAIIEPMELGHLLRDIDEYCGEISTCYALKLMPYVLVRSKELRGQSGARLTLMALRG